jgi:hypothetical protein
MATATGISFPSMRHRCLKLRLSLRKLLSTYSTALSSVYLLILSHIVCKINYSNTMAKKKTSMFPHKPTENNIHAGEEVVVVEKPSATPSTSVDGEAAEDAREEPNMDEFAISYTKT